MRPGERYIYICSDDCNNLFPGNKASSFTISIPEALIFESDWEVALVQFAYPPTKIRDRTVSVVCDIAEDSIVGESRLPILRRVTLSAKGKSIIYPSPHYHKVKNNHIRQLSIQVLNQSGDEHSFSSGSSWFTLHFRRCRR